ncbi:hypothetical protein GCM10025868_03220 [Angustibacter aerolatus]|uniref:Uncharacterized protein n=1 Tax=Angustibacter aerolatus TaxID=1162965 RepID=A0ABQ6JBA3_9ACTN|nr:hypothetical protein GCM10025868_03220 [Angustibacter aerolatus]
MSTAAPEPVGSTRTARGRRERTLAVLLALAGAAACLLAGSRTWVRGTVVDDLLGRVPLTASGRQAAPVVVAVAVVALAAALAVAVGRRVGRTVAGLVLVLAGAAAAAGAVSALGTPASALTEQVVRATARTGAGTVTATVTGWPWLAVVGGALTAVAGAVVVVRARRLDHRVDPLRGAPRRVRGARGRGLATGRRRAVRRPRPGLGRPEPRRRPDRRRAGVRPRRRRHRPPHRRRHAPAGPRPRTRPGRLSAVRPPHARGAPMAEHEDHGNTPAAWACVGLIMIGALVVALAVVFTSVLLTVIGVVVVVAGLVVGKVLSMAGYGSFKPAVEADSAQSKG